MLTYGHTRKATAVLCRKVYSYRGGSAESEAADNIRTCPNGSSCGAIRTFLLSRDFAIRRFPLKTILRHGLVRLLRYSTVKCPIIVLLNSLQFFNQSEAGVINIFVGAFASLIKGISLLREVAVGPPPWRGLTARYIYQAPIPSACTRIELSPRRRLAGTRKLPMKMACKLTLSLCALLVLASCSPLPTDEGDEDTVVILPAEIDDSENSIDDDGRIDLSYLGSEVFGQPSNESGAALEQWSESSLMNPEEMGEYAEGDILIPTARGRNGINAESARWPDGIVPYVIEGYFNQQQRDTIMKAIADYHRLTCIRFVPYSGQRDYITIRSQSTGCWSSVGKLGGRQEVNLQTPGCVTKKGTVLHELLHALGFMHEQSRPERDEYVDIRYNNIKPGSELNFKKADRKDTVDFGVVYDYNSVMHYSDYAFSKNGQKTIEPKMGGVKLGQREGLSRGDVRKLNNMYNCKKEEPQNGWLGAVWQGFFGKN